MAREGEGAHGIPMVGGQSHCPTVCTKIQLLPIPGITALPCSCFHCPDSPANIHRDNTPGHKHCPCPGIPLQWARLGLIFLLPLVTHNQTPALDSPFIKLPKNKERREQSLPWALPNAGTPHAFPTQKRGLSSGKPCSEGVLDRTKSENVCYCGVGAHSY